MDIYKTICSVTADGRGLVCQSARNSAIFQNELPRLLETHVREINSLLNNGQTREQGVSFLLDLVDQCPLETLCEQGNRWFRFCSQALSSVSNVQAKLDTCQVLLHLLRDKRMPSELRRAITSASPTPLIFTLAGADPPWKCAALECLWEYLRTAPGPCLPHRAFLENQMIRYLDEPIPSTGVDGGVRWAGRVYAVLPLPGQGGPKSLGHAEARTHQLSQLLSLAHSVMDYLFEGIIEKESFEHSREHRLGVADLWENAGENPTKALLAAVTRLFNTASFIAEFITTEAILAIHPQDLLSVIFRILQLETSVLSKYRSQEHKLMALIMPSLHQHVLLLLQDILFSVSESVDQYWGPLTDLLAMVSKSYAGDGGQTTRRMAYSVLDTLLQISEGRHPPPPALLSQVIKDITPTAHQVKLQKDKKFDLLGLELKTKKRKRALKTETSDSITNEPELLPLLFNQLSSTALVALKLARTTLTHALHSVSTSAHQQLQSALLSVAGIVVGRAATRLPDLYVCPQARAALYTTLAALATSPSRRWPPPYTLIMDLLKTGMADENTEVGTACQLALASVSFTVASPQVCALSQLYQLHKHNSTLQEEEEDVAIENGQSFPEGVMAEDKVDENEQEENNKQDEAREEEEERNVNESSEEEAAIIHSEDSEEEKTHDKEEKVHEKDEEIETDLEPETMEGIDDERSVRREMELSTTKRPVEAEAPLSATKKSKGKNKNDPKDEGQHIGPCLEDMLASFVDADPDD
ncbi:hypothetical protein Pcinc_030309 [Petrolisthes cinctipes]|uniref:Pre-rRNA-processing protein RIX1 N-terminal domain-containing protein n=1 Tax=Petrolisthes cinctipes TaxID=88211 RepID=A0AAE1EZ21_PETCI|nr:hypothetical protein Pcinc_030309 [Petrolisthes cinctipes]